MEILQEKSFLAQEFLTWLWYVSEEEEALSLEDRGPVSVLVGDRMVLGPIPGAEGSRVTVKGESANLAEAREGLRRGKLVESLRLGLALEAGEFWCTLSAPDLGVTGLKLPPAGDDGEDERTGKEGLILERIFLIQTLVACVEGLYGLYLQSRLAGADGEGVIAKMKAWALRTD